MNATAVRSRNGMRFGVAGPYASVLEERGCADLVSSLLTPPPESKDPLSGRRAVLPFEFPGLGDLVVKHYARGGVFGRLVKNRYFRFGPTRGEREFQMLSAVRKCGVSAPEPVAFVAQGIFFYRAWLIMRRLPGTVSLAELSGADEDRARKALTEAIRQIELLIEQRVFHIDLHPGNVLVDGDDRVFLVDFDKAKKYAGSLNDLRDRYLCRWRRAVIKHNLPDILSEMVSAGLRRNYE